MTFLDKLFYSTEPGGNINILMYHGFTDRRAFGGIENYHGKHLLVAKFRQQMEFVKEHYHALSLKELVGHLAGGKKLPPRSIVITIDDGYRSNYTLAYPVFKEFQIPATIFLATDFIDRKDALWVDRLEFAVNQSTKHKLDVELDGHKLKLSLSDKPSRIEADRQMKTILKDLPFQKRSHMISRIEKQAQTAISPAELDPMYAPLSWDEIREMNASGLIDFGAHTCTHTILTVCSDHSIEEELRLSKQRIEQELKAACDFFSYPNGQSGNFDERTKQAVKEAGFAGALTTIIGTNRGTTDRYELKRLNIHNDGDLSGFIRTQSSLARTLRALKNGNYVRAYS